MRVIAGVHGGRRLTSPDTPHTRPVTDRVKESIFSSLGAFVPGARVADLYAGAGSFGIEALSRGASTAVFVETGRRALAALEDNLAKLGIEATVVRAPVETFVASARMELDLVFCDPPWDLPSVGLASVLEDLLPTLAPQALVVITRRSTDEVPVPGGYGIDDDRRHGDTRIIRYAIERDPE